jgi:hypothetical protein
MRRFLDKLRSREETVLPPPSTATIVKMLHEDAAYHDHDERGEAGDGDPVAAVVWGRHGLVGPDSPLQHVAAPILVGACGQKD